MCSPSTVHPIHQGQSHVAVIPADSDKVDHNSLTGPPPDSKQLLSLPRFRAVEERRFDAAVLWYLRHRARHRLKAYSLHNCCDSYFCQRRLFLQDVERLHHVPVQLMLARTSVELDGGANRATEWGGNHYRGTLPSS